MGGENKFYSVFGPFGYEARKDPRGPYILLLWN